MKRWPFRLCNAANIAHFCQLPQQRVAYGFPHKCKATDPTNIAYSLAADLIAASIDHAVLKSCDTDAGFTSDQIPYSMHRRRIAGSPTWIFSGAGP